MMERGEYIEHFIGKAGESLDAARSLLREEHYEFSVSRAYYAMFYAAEAVLLTRDLQFKKHTAVIAAFNKDFVKAGVFPQRTARSLKKAFDFRMQGDYSLIPIEKEKAEVVIEDAAGFVSEVTAFLEREGFLSRHRDASD